MINKKELPKKNLGEILIWGVVLISLGLYLMAKFENQSRPETSIILGQASAIIGASMLAINFVLSSKFSWVESIIGGMDKTYKLHHRVGRWSLFFLIMHPLFLASSSWPNWQVMKIYWLPTGSIEYSLGIGALYSLIILLILTVVIKLPYKIWLKTHRLMGIPLLLGAGHALIIGSDMSRYGPLRWWMMGLLALGMAGFIYSRFLFRRWGKKTDFTVDEIKCLRNITEIYLKPETGFEFQPGQYGLVGIEEEGWDQDLHPFSFSSSPGEEKLRLSVKAEGDYTKRLRELKKGSIIKIYGPQGNFGNDFRGDRDVVLIAGGIGVTPFLSMLRAEKNNPKKRKINVFYSIKNKETAYYKEELEMLETEIQNLDIDFIFSDEGVRLTVEMINKKVGGVKDKIIYLCGPGEMIISFRDGLVRLGADKAMIRFEDFAVK